MKTIKMSTRSHDNAVRCAIALSAPMILKIAGVTMRNKSVPMCFKTLFPDYIFEGIDRDIVSPSFVHTDADLNGKRRVYVNANGYRLFFLPSRELFKFRAIICKMYDIKSDRDFIKFVRQVSNKWVVMSFKDTDSRPRRWEEFVERLVLVERYNDKKNHPPTNIGGFMEPTAVAWDSEHGKYLKQTHVTDSMKKPITLFKYTNAV